LNLKKINNIVLLLAFIIPAFAGIKCGVIDFWERKIVSYQERPDMEFYWDTENFRLWYDTHGTDSIDLTDIDPADGVPDWVQIAGSYLEKARACLVDTLNFVAPIPDSTIDLSRSDVGGDDRTDVYFVDMPYYGMTYLDTMLFDGSGPAFLTLENDYDEENFSSYIGREDEALAVTCSHEFFHVIHYSYGSGVNWVWWMEATAVWSEERNFPEINDYINYLPLFQDYPNAPLHKNTVDGRSGRIYGTCLLPIYLSEMYGDSTIRIIWEGIPSHGVYGSILRWADSAGVNLDDVYGDFAKWNLFVGDNYRGFGYPDADLMPEPQHIQPANCPDTITGGGAAIYIEMPVYQTGGIWARVNPIDDISAVMHGVSIRGSDSDDTSSTILGTDGIIPGTWRFDKISAVIAHLSYDSNLESSFETIIYGPDPMAVVVSPQNDLERPPYPNPFIYHSSEMIYFPYSVEENTPIAFSVWTSAGELVYSHETTTNRGFHLEKEGAFGWEPENNEGKKLSSGIYIYKLAIEGKSHIGKFSIING